MSVTTVHGPADAVPEGYTPEDIAQCKALTEQIVAAVIGVKGHVAMSAILTTYNHLVEGYPPGSRLQAGQHLITVGAGIANAAIDDGASSTGSKVNAAGRAQQISNLVATKPHGPTLDALLMVVEALGKKFPCCAGMASAGAAQVAIELGRLADSSQPSASAGTLH